MPVSKMQRVVIPELLDTDAGTSDEIAEALRDLWRINLWFGGVGTSAALVRRVAAKTGIRQFSVLDVGAGSGELPFAVRSRLKMDGILLDILLMDRAKTHLQESGDAVVGDALAIPLRDHAVDLVTSSLFMHHLEPPQIVQFVNDALRVARVGVIINDLRRSRLHLMAACAAFPIFRSRLARHDALASVRRAYTTTEVCEALSATRAGRIEIAAHFLFRMGVIVWK